MPVSWHRQGRPRVAPRSGAWIEIPFLPAYDPTGGVAPRSGAWIEIGAFCTDDPALSRRSPFGSVD